MNDLIIKDLKEIVATDCTNEWCRLPYPQHKNGCPNYGREKCPPGAVSFKKIINPPFKLVAVRFNLEEHAERMKEKHPNWSDKQARCVLYWQKGVDKKLRQECEKIADDNLILYRPEAHYINMFATCRKIGLILEKNPKKYVWKIAIIGKRLER